MLPALNHYLSSHTSIPLDALELTRIGVAGISVGSGRIKVSKVPGRDAVSETKNSLLKRSQGAKDGEGDAADASDRRRAGAVFGFLSKVVEGREDAESK